MAEPVVDEEYLKEIEKARRELRALITANQCAPLMFQLAWNEATTYDATSRKGGPNGSIRTYKKLQNKELGKAIQLCEKVVQEAKPQLKKVTYADLYQLAGVVAIEVSGGPTIEFIPGRKDESMTYSPDPLLLAGVIQDASSSASLKRSFGRTGINDDRDIVALCGGHAWSTDKVKKPPKDPSASECQSLKDPLKFDNYYYTQILENGQSLKPFMDPTEKDLYENFRKHVEDYSKDENLFFKDYAMSHKKLSELGCNLNKLNQRRGLIGIGIVSVSVVTVILGYLLKRKKNQLKK